MVSDTCEWELPGTGMGIYVPCRECGSAAKTTITRDGWDRRVCGRHVRVAVRRGDWKVVNERETGT